MLKIENNIPIPAPARVGGGQRSKTEQVPWSAMKRGQSVLVPYLGRDPLRLQSSLLSATMRLSGDCKFTSRRMPSGIRVWRIA